MSTTPEASAAPNAHRVVNNLVRAKAGPQPECIVFPPMDDVTFAAKLAKWQKRIPRRFVPATGFGRANSKRIDPKKFTEWTDAVRLGRAKQRAEVLASKAPIGMGG